jgi:hypothetical protein
MASNKLTKEQFSQARAAGFTNMQLWSTRNQERFLILFRIIEANSRKACAQIDQNLLHGDQCTPEDLAKINRIMLASASLRNLGPSSA